MKFQWSSSNIHFSLLISFVCLLLTYVIWESCFYSSELINRAIASNLFAGVGILFSAAAWMFTWSLETRREFLENEMHRKTEELLRNRRENKKSDITASAIYTSSHMLFSDLNLDNVLHRVMDLMSKVMKADEGSIMLLDSNNELTIAASSGISPEIVKMVHIPMGERVAGRAAKLRREFLIVDGLDNYPEFQGIEPNPLIRSSIVCPLICQNELLGVINLNRTRREQNFTVSDLLSVSIFAAQVAQAIRNASLFQSLEQKIQELEEVHNRMRVLEERLS